MLKSTTLRNNPIHNIRRFNHGDVVHVVDAKRNYTRLSIKKFIFNAYTDASYKKATLLETTNKSLITISSDAVFSSKEDASKFALLHLIKRTELHVKINTENSVLEQYSEIEQTYPELILKHISKILVS